MDVENYTYIEFRESYQDDHSRKMQLFGSLATVDGHPLRKFLWGELISHASLLS